MTPKAWTAAQPPLPPSQEWDAAGGREPTKATGLPDPWPGDMPGGGLRRSTHLVTNMSMCRSARLFVRTVLADWGLALHADDVCACVSELASNALLHAPRDPANPRRHCLRLIWVTLQLADGMLALQVRDGDPHGPVLTPWPPEGSHPPESGYGLRILQSRADAWSWWPVGGGKVVECRFNVEPPEGSR